MARLKERILFKIVWWMPKSFIYFAAVRLIAYCTTGKYSSQIVPNLSAMDALKRWEVDHVRL